MSGTQLGKIIRKDWPTIAILLATGYADRVPGEDIGLPKITKPYLQRDLANAIGQINPVRRERAAGSSHSVPDQAPQSELGNSCPLRVKSRNLRRTTRCPLSAKSGLQTMLMDAANCFTPASYLCS